jgi:predicted ester cyclase
MTDTRAPLDIYRGFRSLLLSGDYGRLGEVVDIDGYTENCVGLTGWTTGLHTALRNYQQRVASAFTDMSSDEQDIVESGDQLVVRARLSATHSGPFLGVTPTGRRVSYDSVDMYRVRNGRIVWRFLLCDWHGVLAQLTNGTDTPDQDA